MTNKSISPQFQALTSLYKHNPFLHSASEERGERELEVLNQQLGLDQGIIEVGEEQAGLINIYSTDEREPIKPENGMDWQEEKDQDIDAMERILTPT